MKSMTSLGGLIRNTSGSLAGNWWRSIAVFLIIGFLLCGLQMWMVAGQLQLMFNGLSPLGLCLFSSGILLLAVFCGPLLTGGASYFLSVAKNDNPAVRSVFWGFDYFGRSIGVFWLTALLVFLWSLLLIAVMLVIFIGLGAVTGVSVLPALDSGNSGEAAGPMMFTGLIMLVPMIIWMAGLLWIFFRHCLIWFAFAENPDAGVTAAVRRGIAMVRGNYGKLFGAWLLLIVAAFGFSLVLSVIMFFLAGAGQMFVAAGFNVIVGILLMVFFYIFPPAFLAVLFADIKDKA